jgi:hypothetical protein
MAVVTRIIFSALGGKVMAGFQFEDNTGRVIAIGGINGSQRDFDIELPDVADRRSEKVNPGQTRWGDIASERILVSFDEDGIPALPVPSEFRCSA